MKKCRTCEEIKDYSEFHRKSKQRESYQSDCRKCCVERKKNISMKHRKIVGRWKMLKGCSVCGFKGKHSCQLDLDHVNKADKNPSLDGHSYQPCWSMKRIKQELSKCRVVCKNCHAVKTTLNKDYMPSLANMNQVDREMVAVLSFPA
jgi:hypothetical protein